MCNQVEGRLPLSVRNPYQFELIRKNLTNLNRRKIECSTNRAWVLAQTSYSEMALGRRQSVQQNINYPRMQGAMQLLFQT